MLVFKILGIFLKRNQHLNVENLNSMASKSNFYGMLEKIFIGFPLFDKTQDVKWSYAGRKKRMTRPIKVLNLRRDNFIVRTTIDCINRF